MIRHPQYLELPSPSDIRRSIAAMGHHRHVWWLIVLLVAVAVCIIGMGVFQWEFPKLRR